MPKVLVVDDDEAVRQLLNTVLKMEGYEVAMARDGREAIRMAEEQSFDAILLDLMMPNLSGEDTLRVLRDRERSSATPVIIITAKEGDEPVVETTVAGADAYLTKPFEPQTVLALLRRLVET